MKRISRILPLLALALGLAAQAPTQIKLKVKELGSNPIRVGQLNLTIRNFQPDTRISKRRVDLHLQNMTNETARLALDELLIVGSNGSQSSLCGWSETFDGYTVHHLLPTQPVLIAPGAYRDMSFFLEHSVKLPARIYMGRDLIAEVSE
jgi:hypothetical protein